MAEDVVDAPLEAKLYEAADQFAALDGFAGPKGQEGILPDASLGTAEASIVRPEDSRGDTGAVSSSASARADGTSGQLARPNDAGGTDGAVDAVNLAGPSVGDAVFGNAAGFNPDGIDTGEVATASGLAAPAASRNLSSPSVTSNVSNVFARTGDVTTPVGAEEPTGDGSDPTDPSGPGETPVDPVPGEDPGPTDGPGPGENPGPTDGPGPGENPGPTDGPGPGENPGPTDGPGPGENPGPTDGPGPGENPGPTDGPGPGEDPGPTDGPGPGEDPGPTDGPGPVDDPETDFDLVVDTIVDLPILDPILGDIDVNLDPIEELLDQDIDIDIDLGIDADDILDPILDPILGGGDPNEEGDTDLVVDTIVDLPVLDPILGDIDVNLDPVEELLGQDIDIDIDVVGDAEELIDTLLGGGDPNEDGDTDLVVDGLVDLPVLDPLLGDIDVNLDPVEQLLGQDIDIDVDLVGDAENLIDGLLGGGNPSEEGDTDLVLDGITDVNLDPVEQILGTDIDLGVDLGGIGDGVGDVLNGATDGLLDGDPLDGLLGDGNPAGDGDTDLVVDGILDVNLDPAEQLLGTDIDLGVDLGGIGDGAGDLLSGDPLADPLGGLLGGGDPNEEGDTDLVLDGITDVNLDPVENLLGTDIDLSVNLGESLDGLLGEGGTGDLLSGDPLTGDLLGDGGTPVDDLLEGAGDLLSGGPDAGDLLDGILGGGGDGSGDGDTDLTLTGLAEVPLDPVEGLLGTDIDAELDLGGTVNDLLGDGGVGDLLSGDPLTGDLLGDGSTPVDDLLEGVGDLLSGDPLGGLLGGGETGGEGDTDLVLTGVTEVPLDPVEDLLGTDIDVELDLANGTGDLLGGTDELLGGTDELLAGAEDLLSGDPLSGDPLGGLLGGGDTGGDADTDLVLTGVTEVPLDPVEDLLGTDIDVELDLANGTGDLLGGTDELLGGTDELLAGAEDLLSGDPLSGDPLGGLLGGGDTGGDADTDLVLTGVTEVPLDPVEDLLGTDIDVELDLANGTGDLLGGTDELLGGTDELLAGAEDLLSGDPLSGDPLGGLLGGGDTGGDADTDLVLTGVTEVPLDPVEDLLGTDIDVELDLANGTGDLLGGTDELLGGIDELLTGDPLAGDLLEDPLNGLLGGAEEPTGDEDTDLVLTGLTEVPLDPVEDLLGTDIDLEVDLTNDTGELLGDSEQILSSLDELLSGDPIFGDLFSGEPLEDPLGDLLGGGETGGDGDTDLVLTGVTEVPLDPVEDLLGTDIDVELDLANGTDELLGDTDELLAGAEDLLSGDPLSGDPLGDLLGGGDTGGDGDTDVVLTGVTEVPLDPVENLLGTDIDVELDLANGTGDLLGGTDELLAGAEDLLSGDPLSGDPLGDLLGGGDTGGDGDTDVVLTGVTEVPLDPVEDLLGTDIDVELDLANGTDELLDGTDELLAGAEDLLSGDPLSGDPLGGDLLSGDPLENPLGDLLGGGDTGGDGDTDLVLTGVTEVPLDPVENLLGTDIDVELDLTDGTGDLLGGTDTLLSDDPLGGLLGDGSDTSTASGDTDLTVDGNVDVPVLDPILADADVTLDPVEDLLGTDIDLDVDLDAVLDDGGNLVNTLGDDTLGDLTEDLTGDLLAGDGSIGGDGDTDLTIDGIVDAPVLDPILADADVTLDPVEDLLGTDIDIDLDADTGALLSGSDADLLDLDITLDDNSLLSVDLLTGDLAEVDALLNSDLNLTGDTSGTDDSLLGELSSLSEGNTGLDDLLLADDTTDPLDTGGDLLDPLLDTTTTLLDDTTSLLTGSLGGGGGGGLFGLH